MLMDPSLSFFGPPQPQREGAKGDEAQPDADGEEDGPRGGHRREEAVGDVEVAVLQRAVQARERVEPDEGVTS